MPAPSTSPDVCVTELGSAVRSSRALDGRADLRGWLHLALGSLVIAGLLSLAVVIGRLPGLTRLIDDPLFFKRCLVVHVDLALVVWFYALLSALLGLRGGAGTGRVGQLARWLVIGGVGAMLIGGMVRGATPVLANYIPVIDHPIFLGGVGLLAVGFAIYLAHALAAPTQMMPETSAMTQHRLPADAAIGLQASAVAVFLALATWISSRAGLPDGVDAWTRYEFTAWGAGHVLQVANTAAMLAVWLWLLQLATGQPVLSSRAARWLFAALVLPHFAQPLLTWRGTLNTLYHSGSTQLMRWGIFPVVLVALFLGLRHLRRHRAGVRDMSGTRGAALMTGFGLSAGLTLLGFVLGACIRSSTTLVPAHYHAALGGVTAAFMTGGYLVVAALGSEALAEKTSALWRSAKRQLLVYGLGQIAFVAGFAIGGFYGLGRKAYAGEQHVRTAGEYIGLGVMGLGGLVAVVGGVWFLVLVIRELRSMRAPAPVSIDSKTIPQPAQP